MLDHTYITYADELMKVECVIVRRFMSPFGAYYRKKYITYHNTLDEAVAYLKAKDVYF